MGPAPRARPPTFVSLSKRLAYPSLQTPHETHGWPSWEGSGPLGGLFLGCRYWGFSPPPASLCPVLGSRCCLPAANAPQGGQRCGGPSRMHHDRPMRPGSRLTSCNVVPINARRCSRPLRLQGCEKLPPWSLAQTLWLQCEAVTLLLTVKRPPWHKVLCPSISFRRTLSH